nr:hypothetical protein CFP56_12718 [Quercus suber]
MSSDEGYLNGYSIEIYVMNFESDAQGCVVRLLFRVPSLNNNISLYGPTRDLSRLFLYAFFPHLIHSYRPHCN